MVVYGLYIYDRHCTCCFYTDLGQRPYPIPGPSTLPKVLPPAPSSSSSAAAKTAAIAPNDGGASSSAPATSSVRSRDMVDSKGTGGGYTVPDAVASRDDAPRSTSSASSSSDRLAFDEEAKLVYGVVFSLKNMVSKLSTRRPESDSFQAMTTSAYKLHYLATASAFHFVLLTSPAHASCRPLLRQIYTGPFNEYVVRNPLANLDTQRGGKGIDNQAFRRAVEKLLVAAAAATA